AYEHPGNRTSSAACYQCAHDSSPSIAPDQSHVLPDKLPDLQMPTRSINVVWTVHAAQSVRNVAENPGNHVPAQASHDDAKRCVHNAGQHWTHPPHRTKPLVQPSWLTSH